MVKCDACNGDGERWMLPKGNPFHMRITTLARAMRKVQCWKCKGEGYVRGPGLNAGSGPQPEGIPND